MTKNQIDYQSFLESKRHNVTNEQEAFRHNAAAEQLELSSQAIGARQAAASKLHAQAASTSASANYLNALTNQRAQDLKEEQWRSPIVGTAAGNAANVFGQALNFVGKFIQLIK